jgi:hypothetical protein
MHDIRNLSDAALMDMLTKQTTKLTSLLAGLLKDNEYLQCKGVINALNEEIEARKNSRGNPSSVLSDGLSPQK